jgi:hypothetical protein
MPYKKIQKVCNNCGTVLGECYEHVNEGESTTTVTETVSSCAHCPKKTNTNTEKKGK